MKILCLPEIREFLRDIDLVQDIEAGFVAYSRGEAVVPPVGELVFDQPPGDVHIKYGYLRGDDYYVIKIASGFYENAKLGLPTSNGMMLLFRQQTGEPLAALLDEGFLTDVRTAAAGAIAAKYLAPPEVHRIGIAGSGMQARLQLDYLKPVTECRTVLLWARNRERGEACAADMRQSGFDVEVCRDANALLQGCELIVTTTAATAPLLTDTSALRPGTHITAMGSDTETKQELHADLLARADVIVADSISQCRVRGEIHQALSAGAIEASAIVELGSIIAGDAKGRTAPSQVTIADLTGVAVQDIQVSKAVFERASA